jgi:predicted RNA-binding protein (TIGR00451 family)
MKHLSGKDKKSLTDKLPSGYQVSKKDEVIEKNGILWKNKEPYLILKNGKYFPHLKKLDDSFFKSVYVDRGAIPFVLKGADLMRAGIQIIDDSFEKDDIILVKDEEHKKTIAVGVALFSSVDMKAQSSGKSVKPVHLVGDEFYYAEL